MVSFGWVSFVGLVVLFVFGVGVVFFAVVRCCVVVDT